MQCIQSRSFYCASFDIWYKSECASKKFTVWGGELMGQTGKQMRRAMRRALGGASNSACLGASAILLPF